MHFAFCVDANYVKYAGILMHNLLALHPEEQLNFHLMTTGVDEEDEKRLDIFAKKFADRMNLFVYDATELLAGIPMGENAPPRLKTVVLLRIMLAECLPENVDRVIYMDVDMLVLTPLKELWQTDLQGKAIAAVPYMVEEKDNITPLEPYQIELGFDHDTYFNAGLMVQDLRVWRQTDLMPRVVECYLKNSSSFKLLEQDALNTVIGKDYVKLPARYNIQREANHPYLQYPQDTAVLHLVNEAKQWCMGCNPLIYRLYLPYVEQSEWHGMDMQEPMTVKAGYLAAMNAELHGDEAEALKYYKRTAKALMSHYYPQFLAETEQLPS